ncbi:MAG: hypothetical protein JRN44_02720 [Nitrososphaerota archaeon]|nr:hypothetical protein [Nitrososphaerota archaeon]
MKQNNPDDILEGTTRRVFRFVYRQQSPVGIHDVQRGLGLSSPSVAHYHIGKLLKAGLLKEEGDGYVVDKVVFENMIRVSRTAIPLQIAYAVFLLSALALLVTMFRPVLLSATFVFAVVVIGVALAVSLFEAYKAVKAPV